MRKIKNIGLTAKLVLAVLLSSLAIYLLIFGLEYKLTHKVITDNIDEISNSMVGSSLEKVDEIVQIVGRITNSMEFYLEHSADTEDNLDQLLREILRNADEIFGVSISFQPYAFDQKEKYFSPYCRRDGAGVKCKMLGGEDYDYFNMEWYKKCQVDGVPVWTDPYYDEDSGDVYILSRSAPFYRKTKDGKVFRGVVSADISLEWLQNAISKVTSSHGGYAFVISPKGTFITFPKEGFALKRSIIDVANELDDDDIRRIGKKMLEGKTGVEEVNDFITGKSSWLYYKPITSSGWSLGVVFEKKKLLSDAYYLIHSMIIIGTLGLCILFVILFIISSRITRPLVQLSSSASEIAHGNLDVKIPTLSRGDEVGRLARSFTTMQKDLKKYIGELTTAAAARERIENELKIAHDIQQSIVPKEFPEIVASGSVLVHGTLMPAREVAGDLYDCFEIDDRHTCFVVGDVSDKGVHAALIMAIVSTLLRGLSKDLRRPDEILRIVNKEIMERDTNSMFVTLFCGILNNDTGKFRYANAGHCPPVLIRKGADPTFLTEDVGMALGVDKNAKYSWKSITLKSGDNVFIYTDGVTDAVNSNGIFFGEDGLLEVLGKQSDTEPEKVVHEVLKSVKGHAYDTPLADDIAILSFSYTSPLANKSNKIDIRIKNTPDEIAVIADIVTEFCNNFGCSAEIINDLNLAIEEIIVNIMNFGHDDAGTHKIDIALEHTKDSITAVIKDDGKAFDPLKIAPPDIDLPLERRPIGGLGIFLVKRLVDKIVYEHSNGLNVLTLTKSI